MRLQDVALNHEVRKLVDRSAFPNQTDASSLAQRGWFQNPDRCVISVHFKQSKLVGEDVGLGQEAELFSKLHFIGQEIEPESILDT